MEMPKEAFGGDDDSSGAAEEKKKMGLSKFGLAPDINIRDEFWRIMGSYAATKKPGTELSALSQDRFALMRIALSILESQHSENYGMPPKFLSTYALMMMLDGDWKDAFVEFLRRGRESRSGIKADIAYAIRKLLPQEAYGPRLVEVLNSMLRGKETGGDALAYIADAQSEELVRPMKKELMIIARGDIGENQLNAIKAISLIRDDDEVKKSLIVLLSHWDAMARLAAAEVLLSFAHDKDVRAAAEKRLQAETDPEIREMLARMIGAKE